MVAIKKSHEALEGDRKVVGSFSPKGRSPGISNVREKNGLRLSGLALGI